MARWTRWSVGALTMGVMVGLGLSAMGATDAGKGADEARIPEEEVRPSPERGREEIIALLSRKEQDLQRREATLLAREQDLRAAEEEVTKRLTEVQAVREEIRGMLTGLDDKRAAKVAGLVKMFESIKSQQAAQILLEQEPAIALEILSRMKKDKAGKALAAMPPKRAAWFADRLGGPALMADAELAK